MPKTDLKTITQAEWEETGRRLYGDNRLLWKFRCPSCGNVQCAEDFRQYKVEAANTYSNCIGRFDGIHGDTPMGTIPGPCNYASGGLLNINPVCVEIDGKQYFLFAFADE